MSEGDPVRTTLTPIAGRYDIGLQWRPTDDAGRCARLQHPTDD